MNLALYIIIFLVSLSVLLKASDFFIDSSEKIGISFGISPFVIGITIVAFGTSLPELATSISAMMANESGIVLGNVVGSNIANILLVFGITIIASGKETPISRSIIHLDIPVLLIATAALWYATRDFSFLIYEAVIFLVVLAAYLIKSIRKESGNLDKTNLRYTVYLIFALSGVFVFLGSKYTIFSIEKISEIVGISTELIALSMVALGTSLPEVIVSIQAARRGKTDMALGNVIGSNIFNILAVMGIPALIGTLDIASSILDFSLPFMFAVTVLLAVLCVYGRIFRWIGVLFVILYLLYMIYLALGVV
ncbi:MAG: calcium/sodium antiporter [Bacteroidia bacterium]|nr:calcium/sodium antiporter [Bacteroidia bacterium]